MQMPLLQLFPPDKFVAQDIQTDGDQNDAAGDGLLGIGIDVQKHDAVGDHADKRRTNHRAS